MPIATNYDVQVEHHAYVDREAAETKVGILSPQCQFEREIEAIKQTLREKYGDSIDYNKIVFEKDFDTNMITVKIDQSIMTVKVSYLPPLNPELIGAPQRFELTFIDPIWN